MVCSYRGNNKERIRLNLHVRGPVQAKLLHPKAEADMAAEETKFFTVIDAMKGYPQCPLDEESQALTMFIIATVQPLQVH